MHVTFYGAIREVTGSMHQLEAGKDRILLDCGLFQGRRKETEAKNRVFPVDPELITNMILSHAHIDHSGRIPLLVKGGFNGRVITTRTTADACSYLLRDSAHIQESDALYLNYKTVRGHLYNLANGKNHLTNRERSEITKLLKHNGLRLNKEAIAGLLDKHNLNSVEPLYTMADAEAALTAFDGYPYNTPVTIGKGMTVTFYEAGHILGSALCLLSFRERGRRFNVIYTGDIGRFGRPILKNPTLRFPENLGPIDLMIMESTYGARHHEPTEELKDRLAEVINDTYDRKGVVVIPAFAFGRTQDVVYIIHELLNEGRIPKLPVFVDSPLAGNLTRVFAEHPEVYDKETHRTFLEKGMNPFEFKGLSYISTVAESMECMKSTTPHIIISSSGMCEAGRILHHLRYRVHNPNNTIVIVGYMAQHTLGRRIMELGWDYKQNDRKGKPPVVKILGKEYPLKADVVKIGGFSAHADREEMHTFLKKSNLQVKNIAVVHGEEEQSKAFAAFLKEKGLNAFVPKRGQTITME
ncbi:MBL fold metallo-hydrolase RNA specificity domain-containing protein [Desulfoluna spongiiphila]|uniref:Metallo-beta-lactamase family protein n=1 Tax=Desulfoluna spongiiphila TaxID=419481 RepID=A0A1G5HM48_9BACT|nr:MBL fold metallo-hydrolase [Desulfoluna spongiiphila]SCY64400.1 metallo-beta-lactamase family protein [Desulfoluna spongiiphila]